MYSKKKGFISEQIVVEYLTSLGYILLESNFFAGKSGEIDIIFEDNDFIVFVEVKSVHVRSGYEIYDSISRKKKRRIRNSINTWLYKHDKVDKPWRVDFVGVTWGGKNGPKIDHFKFLEL